MKTVFDLLNSCKCEEILSELFKIFPDEEQNIVAYQNAWKSIHSVPPVNNKDKLVCVVKLDDDDIDIIGRGIDGEIYALDFLPWSEWLSLPVESEYSDQISLALILYEMTVISFDERSKKECFDSIISDVDDIRNKYGLATSKDTQH